MLLDLNKLHGQREHVERTLQPVGAGAGRSRLPCRGSGRAVDGRLEGGRGCVRSERPGANPARTRVRPLSGALRIPVDATFELRYVPQPHADDASASEDAEEREIGEDDLTTAFYKDGLLDIGDLLREQFQLALPMKPLCSDACRGLCPQCGANLNRTDCGCSPAWEDPRLAPLKSLLNRPKEN